ncbi:uncharacterized protein E0L32_008684 [Thyridium curvatum]|uniref:Uncharacterized protein n=1 Tax=Thyridium curvatum TaxID=1093900 RepID=A0A507AZ30_9PEZI|nr:uncharacterized protein E0L32_008684 [Thyridium curvatum]TPX10279.1 hypothetical protein E0L32_008684 [Thyridium curvatum]
MAADMASGLTLFPHGSAPHRQQGFRNSISSSEISPFSQCSTLISASDSSVSTPSEMLGPVYGDGLASDCDADSPAESPSPRRTPYPGAYSPHVGTRWRRHAHHHGLSSGSCSVQPGSSPDRPVLDLGTRSRGSSAQDLFEMAMNLGASPAELADALELYPGLKEAALASHAKRLDALLRKVESRSRSGALQQELDTRFGHVDKAKGKKGHQHQIWDRITSPTVQGYQNRRDRRDRTMPEDDSSREFVAQWLAKCKEMVSPSTPRGSSRPHGIRESFVDMAHKVLRFSPKR